MSMHKCSTWAPKSPNAGDEYTCICGLTYRFKAGILKIFGTWVPVLSAQDSKNKPLR